MLLTARPLRESDLLADDVQAYNLPNFLFALISGEPVVSSGQQLLQPTEGLTSSSKCAILAGCSSLPYYSTIFIASYNVMWSSLPIIGFAVFEQVRMPQQKSHQEFFPQSQASEGSCAGPQAYQCRAKSSTVFGNTLASAA